MISVVSPHVLTVHVRFSLSARAAVQTTPSLTAVRHALHGSHLRILQASRGGEASAHRTSWTAFLDGTDAWNPALVAVQKRVSMFTRPVTERRTNKKEASVCDFLAFVSLSTRMPHAMGVHPACRQANAIELAATHWPSNGSSRLRWTHSESLQFVSYHAGQYFKPHTDYFRASSNGTLVEGDPLSGQRVFTAFL